MQYGSAGAGSATHLGCVLLNYLIGVDITHVPYRGTGPAMQDLQGGRIDYLCEIVSTAKPQIDGGTVKPIAIMTKERSKALPNVPTGLEQGTPNLEAYTWNALFLPKGAPADVVKKLNDAAVQAMKTPAVRERLEAARRRDRCGRPGDAGISRPVPQGRDRKMGGADQGQRRERGLARPRHDVRHRRRQAADRPPVRQVCGLSAQPGTAAGTGGASFQLDLALDLVREADAAERDGGLGGKFFVAFELAVRHGLAHRLLDLALGTSRPSVLRNLRMLLLKTSSFMIAPLPPVRGEGLPPNRRLCP